MLAVVREQKRYDSLPFIDLFERWANDPGSVSDEVEDGGRVEAGYEVASTVAAILEWGLIPLTPERRSRLASIRRQLKSSRAKLRAKYSAADIAYLLNHDGWSEFWEGGSDLEDDD